MTVIKKANKENELWVCQKMSKFWLISIKYANFDNQDAKILTESESSWLKTVV